MTQNEKAFMRKTKIKLMRLGEFVSEEAIDKLVDIYNDLLLLEYNRRR